MATKLLYLEDFDVITCDAKVGDVQPTDDSRTAIILDQTCFYPRGGGQDWDEGVIRRADSKFRVAEVRLDEQGVVRHIGTFQSGNFKPGDAVQCAVDTEWRQINTRLHSAGHVVDVAVDRLQLPWLAGKGAHYPHMSFVEYTGEIDPGQAETIRSQIEQTANTIITAGGDNQVRFMPVSEMHTVCRHVPANIPTNKPARVVMYGDFGIPCGGTHVRNLRDIGHLTITKIKAKKGIIKVSYGVGGINE